MIKEISNPPHWSYLLPPPPEEACVFSCQQGRYLVVAKDFELIPFADVKNLKLGRQTDAYRTSLPFATGYVALISYDACAQLSNPAPLVCWRVNGAAVYDTVACRTWLTGTCSSLALYSCQYPAGALHLQTYDRDAYYHMRVQQIVEDIRAGRYYLLNYLRFFAVNSHFERHTALTSKFIRSTAPYKAMLRWEDQAIYSFSPEHFVSVNADTLLCSPIKGTASRSTDTQQDLMRMRALQSSEKDLAELHITVDLARNDIGRIANAIRVHDAGRVRSFRTVHHLVAKIQATLSAPISLQEFLQAMCPAASISGAPKVEVIQAISDYESQPRGYLMGNIICIDDSCLVDSSVLIRTVWSRGDNFTYAAGGGITLASKPDDELLEVSAKTKTLLS
ncbi:MAG: chorismate-binding protein [Pseudomonadota bacterium]|nr:chorismate-binding protein [Pseudomonadota bacterium]